MLRCDWKRYPLLKTQSSCSHRIWFSITSICFQSPQVQKQRAQAAKKAKATTLAQAKQNFESKHPVSLLGELSAKRKFGAPLYELVMQDGPSHQRQFLYSVSNIFNFQSNIFFPTIETVAYKHFCIHF